jgi:hypothetical protein
MNEQQLAAVKQALEALEWHESVWAAYRYRSTESSLEAIAALQSIISQDALHKMAEESRTSGLRLDDWDKIGCVNHDCDKCKAVQKGRDWSLLEATQESLREHMAEIKRLKAAQPAPVQEPVACAVCNKVHAILDADESEIIRNAKDGYPEGRTPRILTLQERVTALCVYASDWKRWCLEKENTTPPAPQPVPVKTYHDGKPWPVAPKPWVGLTNEERNQLWRDVVKWGDPSHDDVDLMKAIEAKLKEKNHA